MNKINARRHSNISISFSTSEFHVLNRCTTFYRYFSHSLLFLLSILFIPQCKISSFVPFLFHILFRFAYSPSIVTLLADINNFERAHSCPISTSAQFAGRKCKSKSHHNKLIRNNNKSIDDIPTLESNVCCLVSISTRIKWHSRRNSFVFSAHTNRVEASGLWLNASIKSAHFERRSHAYTDDGIRFAAEQCLCIVNTHALRHSFCDTINSAPKCSSHFDYIDI